MLFFLYSADEYHTKNTTFFVVFTYLCKKMFIER